MRELTPVQIMNELEQCKNALTQGNTKLKSLGVEKSKSEYNYRIELAKELCRLRTFDKTPVSIIGDMARGNKRIATLRLQRDIAKISYESCKENLRQISQDIEVLRSMLTYLRVELKNS